MPNLIQVGRNGLHRYNNSDHSMLTAMRAVENITKGTKHDIWAVNAESVYHEEQHGRRAPVQARPRDRAACASPSPTLRFPELGNGPIGRMSYGSTGPW